MYLVPSVQLNRVTWSHLNPASFRPTGANATAAQEKIALLKKEALLGVRIIGVEFAARVIRAKGGAFLG